MRVLTPPPIANRLFCYSIHYPNIVINRCVDNFMLFISVLQQLSTISTGFVYFFVIVLVVLLNYHVARISLPQFGNFITAQR